MLAQVGKYETKRKGSMRVCDREGMEKKVTIAKSFIRQVQESGI